MTGLPAAVRESVEAFARRQGTGTRIERLVPASGGCISHAATLILDGDVRLFVKWRAGAPPGMFAAEAEGLRVLRAAVTAAGAEVRIPEPLACGDQAATGWLLLEHVHPGPRDTTTDEALGRTLAVMHGAETAVGWGWGTDNWIGSLRQANRPHARWCDFWAEERIGPQLSLARAGGHCRQAAFDQLIDVIPDALGGDGPGAPTPALLHGDLWSGNAYAATDGTPVLIDPAVYRGDPEVDLAMTELFGGFGTSFYTAYDAIRTITPEYGSHRRDLYQLYYLLVHVNLFGASYEAGARTAAERVLFALR